MASPPEDSPSRFSRHPRGERPGIFSQSQIMRGDIVHAPLPSPAAQHPPPLTHPAHTEQYQYPAPPPDFNAHIMPSNNPIATYSMSQVPLYGQNQGIDDENYPLQPSHAYACQPSRPHLPLNHAAPTLQHPYANPNLTAAVTNPFPQHHAYFGNTAPPVHEQTQHSWVPRPQMPAPIVNVNPPYIAPPPPKWMRTNETHHPASAATFSDVQTHYQLHTCARTADLPGSSSSHQDGAVYNLITPPRATAPDKSVHGSIISADHALDRCENNETPAMPLSGSTLYPQNAVQLGADVNTTQPLPVVNDDNISIDVDNEGDRASFGNIKQISNDTIDLVANEAAEQVFNQGSRLKKNRRIESHKLDEDRTLVLSHEKNIDKQHSQYRIPRRQPGVKASPQSEHIPMQGNIASVAQFVASDSRELTRDPQSGAGTFEDPLRAIRSEHLPVGPPPRVHLRKREKPMVSAAQTRRSPRFRKRLTPVQTSRNRFPSSDDKRESGPLLLQSHSPGEVSSERTAKDGKGKGADVSFEKEAASSKGGVARADEGSKPFPPASQDAEKCSTAPLALESRNISHRYEPKAKPQQGKGSERLENASRARSTNKKLTSESSDSDGCDFLKAGMRGGAFILGGNQGPQNDSPLSNTAGEDSPSDDIGDIDITGNELSSDEERDQSQRSAGEARKRRKASPKRGRTIEATDLDDADFMEPALKRAGGKSKVRTGRKAPYSRKKSVKSTATQKNDKSPSAPERNRNEADGARPLANATGKRDSAAAAANEGHRTRDAELDSLHSVKEQQGEALKDLHPSTQVTLSGTILRRSPRKRKRAQTEDPITEKESSAIENKASPSSSDEIDDETVGEFPSQEGRGSQPVELEGNVKVLKRRKRPKKKEFLEKEFKTLSPDELRIIRIAFVTFFPAPPSNMQVQGRYEAAYGSEMTSGMVKNIWESELKPWSNRWWQLYGDFNQLVREKKLNKPKNRNPTIKEKEVQAWAEQYRKTHGDARLASTQNTVASGAPKFQGVSLRYE